MNAVEVGVILKATGLRRRRVRSTKRKREADLCVGRGDAGA